MSWISRFRRAATSYVGMAAGFNRNVRLLLVASMLGGMAQGIFGVDFNLYILSLGMEPDTLGNILSAGPLAHALASIPIGFLSESFGFTKAFVGIYGLAGLWPAWPSPDRSWCSFPSSPPTLTTHAELTPLATAA